MSERQVNSTQVIDVAANQILSLTLAGLKQNSIVSNVSSNAIYCSVFPGISSNNQVDSRAAFINAMSLAVTTNSTLIVDSQVYINIGIDYTKPLWMPSNLNMDFLAGGMLIIDNNFLPGLNFTHAQNITINRMHLRWIGQVPLYQQYQSNWANYNDITGKNYLQNNYGNSFANGGSYLFTGGFNAQAPIFMTGNCRNIQFNGLTIDVPQTYANGMTLVANSFCPICISIQPQWLPNTTVNTNSFSYQTTGNTQICVPSDIVFNDVILDGYIMGVQSSGGGFTFNNPIARRYTDLQDSSYLTNGTGNNWGGQANAANWVPPPHMFYIESMGGTGLQVPKIINNGYDFGEYVGGTTRRAGSGSGSLCSLKFDADSGAVVRGFKTGRQDGLIDIINYGLTVMPGDCQLNDLVAYNYNSALVRADSTTFPAVRILSSTSAPFNRVTINRMAVIDVASIPQAGAFNLTAANSYGVIINDFQYWANDWNGGGIGMTGNNIKLTGEIFLANCTYTGTFDAIYNNPNNGIQGCYFNIKVYGWRVINNMAFNGAPTQNSTSNILQNNWPFPTDNYTVTFPSNQQRLVTFTNGSNTATWTGGLPVAEATQYFDVNILNGNNFQSMRMRVLPFGGGAQGGVNDLGGELYDISNQHKQVVEGGLVTETWAQSWFGTPINVAANAMPTTIVFPATFGIDRIGYGVDASLGTNNALTLVNAGYSGNTKAFAANLNISSGSNGPLLPPLNGYYILPGTEQVLLTPAGGAFDNTGNCMITVRGIRMYGTG